MTLRLLVSVVAAALMLAHAAPAAAQRDGRAPVRLPGSSLPRRAPAPDPPPRRAAPPPPRTPAPARPAETAARTGADRPAPDNISLARQLGLQVSRVVIDAGHGGRDPGARGHGLRESDIVLDIARRTARLLGERHGVDVVMTRNDDTFIPLRDRTALANEVGADLFLSIHANASRNVKAHGVETYFANLALDREAERVAARENQAAGGTMKDLDDLLEALATNSKLQESQDFATVVQRAMVENLRPANPKLRDLGVKQAPFFVLIGARMPSILAEVSFVSNRAEARLLADDDYRERIAEALTAAVATYRGALDAGPAPTQQD